MELKVLSQVWLLKGKGKVRVLVIALLTTRPAALLQSQKWQLIGMS